MSTKYKLISNIVEQSSRVEVLKIAEYQKSKMNTYQIPVVDYWIQLTLPVLREPNPAESQDFSKKIRNLYKTLQRKKIICSWYFLHKPPGLKIRFKANPQTTAACTLYLLKELQKIKLRWLGLGTFDSFIDQRELFFGFNTECQEILLSLSAASSLDATIKQSKSDIEGWAYFTVQFFLFFFNDLWWVWEVLGRLEKLRVVKLIQDKRPSPSTKKNLLNPNQFLNKLLSQHILRGSALRAGSSVLILLIYIYNQWRLPQDIQSAVIARAREMTKPML